MDIQHWLENIEYRAPPDEQDELGMPAFLQPRCDTGHPIRKYRRKRKRESSDSSIIRPQQANHGHRQAAICAFSPVHGSHSAARSQSPQGSRSRCISRHAVHELAHKKYEKRARYKTRPDHYDVKPPKRCRRRDTRSERERRRLRHQSHRSGDGHRTTGLVQSFHLKNGPKNHRLTVCVTQMCLIPLLGLIDDG